MLPWAASEGRGVTLPDLRCTVVDGQQVSNVTELVDQLRAATAKTSVFAPAEAVEEKRWCSWTEDKLLPIINVNVFRSPKEAKVVMGVAIKKTDMNVVNRTFVYQAGSWYKYFVSHTPFSSTLPLALRC